MESNERTETRNYKRDRNCGIGGIIEMKIGMYTEEEIFEYMTDCEGSFLGRSMYDAIFDKIHALITKNEFLTKRENKLQTIEQMYKSGSVDLDKLRKIVMEEK